MQCLLLRFCCCHILARFWLSKIWRGQWYMANFGGISPKRHLGWSNDFHFMDSIMKEGGYLSPEARQALGPSKLVKRGVSALGKSTYTGVSKALKQSQSLGLI